MVTYLRDLPRLWDDAPGSRRALAKALFERTELARTVDGAELFLYPGDRHLFADSSLPDHDEAAANLLMQRVQDFLNKPASARLRS